MSHWIFVNQPEPSDIFTDGSGGQFDGLAGGIVGISHGVIKASSSLDSKPSRRLASFHFSLPLSRSPPQTLDTAPVRSPPRRGRRLPCSPSSDSHPPRRLLLLPTPSALGSRSAARCRPHGRGPATCTTTTHRQENPATPPSRRLSFTQLLHLEASPSTGRLGVVACTRQEESGPSLAPLAGDQRIQAPEWPSPSLSSVRRWGAAARNAGCPGDGWSCGAYNSGSISTPTGSPLSLSPQPTAASQTEENAA
jgi:hypothetical protein